MIFQCKIRFLFTQIVKKIAPAARNSDALPMGSLQITRATRPFGAAPAALPIGGTMVISPENQDRASFSAAPAVLPMVSTTVISPENHGRASFGAAPAVLPIGSTMVISPDRQCRAASATE